jgi:serine protease Do
MAIAKELIEHGKVIRPWLGILGIGLNKEIAQYYNLSVDEGVFITRSFERSPAWAQGITSGDVILKVDGKPVKDMSELAGYVRKQKIGDVIVLSIRRGNLQGDVQVKLAEIPTSK